MERVAISIGPIDIYWYAICIFVGMLLAFIISIKEAKKQNVNKDFMINLGFYIILFGIIGARLYYVLFNLKDYLKDPIEIIRIWNGGLAIHGGIIAGILVTIIYTKKYKANTFKIIDIMVPGVILAQAIGRWGNFFNQEAFGSKTTLEFLKGLKIIPAFVIKNMNIFFEGELAYRQPTFYYESLWCLLGFIILIIMRRRKYTKVKQLTGFYLAWYSLGRFFIEALRSDSLMLGPFKIAQIVSIVLFIVGVILIIVSRKGSKLDNKYSEVYNEIKF